MQIGDRLPGEGLEAFTTPLAIQHGTTEQFGTLKQSVQRMSIIMDQWHDSEDNFYAYSKEDLTFHLLIAEASSNRPAHTLLSAVLPLIKGVYMMAHLNHIIELFRHIDEAE